MDIKDPYQSYIHKSKYARWNDELGRREYWDETVDRFTDYMKERFPGVELEDVREAIRRRDVMPSMRLMFTAGEAHRREEIAGYNCATVCVDSPRAFDEAVYILMNGTGLGFSVENEYVSKLPSVPENFRPSKRTIIVPDSKEGWSRSYRELIEDLYAGITPRWALHKLRPAGARLKTFGGTSSGPEPLDKLFDFTTRTFYNARGRKLKPIEVHEIMCMIGNVIVAGGVRRSALISLSDLNDTEIRDSKKGAFWEDKPHLTLSNNSVSYKEKPTREEFDEEFDALIASGAGERGIFSRYAIPTRNSLLGRDMTKPVSTNPCGEILLRNSQFCNLTEVIVYPHDTQESLAEKIAIAAKIGTLQSAFTNFGEIRDIWAKNTREERLLGVSLTGIMGNPITAEPDPAFLHSLRETAHDSNAYWADEIGIEPSKAVTCVKPSGTVSQLTGVSSGIHTWHSEYYFRRVRSNATEPITQLLIDQGIHWEKDITNPNQYVFTFPVKAPEGALLRDHVDAVDQLKHWMVYSENFTDHNPSITISVRDEEWDDVREYVWENFDRMVGVSFLPYSDAVYQQAPFEEVTKEQYDALVEHNPKSIDWTALVYYESEDQTTGAQELACVASEGGFCEI